MNRETDGKKGNQWRKGLSELLAIACVGGCVPGAAVWAGEQRQTAFAETTPATEATEPTEEELATAAWKLLKKQRNLDTDLLTEHTILTKAKKKNPKVFTPGTDLQILTFGEKKTLPEPYNFTAAPDEISTALGINLPYELFEVDSSGTIVKKLGTLKMTKGEISWEVNTHKNSYIIKETPIVIRKDKKYQATDIGSFEVKVSTLKEKIKGSTKVLLNGADTMAVLKTSSISASKATGTVDLMINKLKSASYGLISGTTMVFDLGDLGKLESSITLYIGTAGLDLGGKTLTIYAVNTQGKAVPVGTTTVSRSKEIAKITIKAATAEAIGKAKL
jgi:hypothetical protein